MLCTQFACWSKQVPWTPFSSQQGSHAAPHHGKPWESRAQNSQQLGKARDPLEHGACSRSHQDSSPAQLPRHHDEESKHLHPARSRPSYAGWWLMCSSLRAAAWTLGVRIKKWISLAVKRSLFMGAGLWIIILCRSLLFSTPTLFF